MRGFLITWSASALIFGAVLNVHAFAARAGSAGGKEDYIRDPMPPGFQVVITELEGPVFANAQGLTLYKWPKRALRNGNAGEIPDKPACDDHVYRENAGLMSPYPGGLELPEADARPSCTTIWPPVLAAADAKPVGNWKVVARPDGRNQWAYEGQALYTSILDKRAGDVYGGTNTPEFGEGPAERYPVGPQSNVPPQFDVRTMMMGRLVTLRDHWSIYTYDGDGRDQSNCTGACMDGWAPILAGEFVRPVSEWKIFERAPGVRQWSFRGRPVYRHVNEIKTESQEGSDVPRWHNVYTQTAPEPPKGFAVKETLAGMVLRDAQGRSIYKYNCGDDAPDQLACDHPDAPQAYRLTVCGGGNVDRCVKAFPYVIAPAGASSGNQVWGTMYIDPKTGKKAAPNQPGALYVWTYRARPVYTFAGGRGYGDVKPSDVNAMNWGEFSGARNGYRALIYRHAFD